MSMVWISLNQVWVPTMEEAVGTLSACITSGPNWPYAIKQLYEGLQPYTPSQGQAFRHSAPGKGGGEPLLVQISQLEVCLLLSAGPRVIYPVGLNGNDESGY